jgi:hypothetical protein
MVYMTTAMIDRGDHEPYIEAAMCKVKQEYVAESLKRRFFGA